jgi:hypothetical protein
MVEGVAGFSGREVEASPTAEGAEGTRAKTAAKTA